MKQKELIKSLENIKQNIKDKYYHTGISKLSKLIDLLNSAQGESRIINENEHTKEVCDHCGNEFEQADYITNKCQGCDELIQ